MGGAQLYTGCLPRLRGCREPLSRTKKRWSPGPQPTRFGSGSTSCRCASTQGTRTARGRALSVRAGPDREVDRLPHPAQAAPVPDRRWGRVEPKKASALAGVPLEKADADSVRAATGHVAIGEVRSATLNPIETWLDPRLLEFDVVWAAAGTPRHALRPADRTGARRHGGGLHRLRAAAQPPLIFRRTERRRGGPAARRRRRGVAWPVGGGDLPRRRGSAQGFDHQGDQLGPAALGEEFRAQVVGDEVDQRRGLYPDQPLAGRRSRVRVVGDHHRGSCRQLEADGAGGSKHHVGGGEGGALALHAGGVKPRGSRTCSHPWGRRFNAASRWPTTEGAAGTMTARSGAIVRSRRATSRRPGRSSSRSGASRGGGRGPAGRRWRARREVPRPPREWPAAPLRPGGRRSRR